MPNPKQIKPLKNKVLNKKNSVGPVKKTAKITPEIIPKKSVEQIKFADELTLAENIAHQLLNSTEFKTASEIHENNSWCHILEFKVDNLSPKADEQAKQLKLHLNNILQLQIMLKFEKNDPITQKVNVLADKVAKIFQAFYPKNMIAEKRKINNLNKDEIKFLSMVMNKLNKYHKHLVNVKYNKSKLLTDKIANCEMLMGLVYQHDLDEFLTKWQSVKGIFELHRPKKLFNHEFTATEILNFEGRVLVEKISDLKRYFLATHSRKNYPKA